MRFTRMKWSAMLALLLISCSKERDEPAKSEVRLSEKPESQKQTEASFTSPPKEEISTWAPEPNFYDGAENWCEPYKTFFCEKTEDCPSWEGRGMRCVKALHQDYSHCVSKHSRREKELWQRRLSLLVSEICHPKDGCVRDDLRSYLALEVVKESSWRPWKRHRLNPDREANYYSYYHYAKHYGFEWWDKDKWMSQTEEDANEYYTERDRWMTGLGWYGQNAALFVFEWSKNAPPEVLCNEVVSTEVALRRGRRVISKLESGIDCDDDDVREFHGHACDGEGCHPSWYDVHNATQRGKLCPVGEKAKRAYERRAAKNNLDPYARVTRASLGRPIKRDGQNERAAELTAKLDNKAPISALP